MLLCVLFGGRKWEVGFVGCFVLGLVEGLGVGLWCVAKKSVCGLIVELLLLSPTRTTRLVSVKRMCSRCSTASSELKSPDMVEFLVCVLYEDSSLATGS
jgi:hypothetical protein